MSLINQVLKDLDKRGAGNAIGEATVRVVHARSRLSAFRLVALGAAGMLLVLAAAWTLWQPRQPPAARPVAIAAVQPAAQLPVSQPAVAPVQIKLPRISGVNPDLIPAMRSAQKITIHGSNFSEGASVTLHEQGGRIYANRPVLSLTAEQIVFKANFGTAQHGWGVEVLNADGASSGLYPLAFKAPPPTAQNQTVATSGKAVPPRAMAGAVAEAGVSKQATQLSLQQQADNEFRRAYQLMREGRNSEAVDGYEAALKLDAGHELARQSLVGLLLEKKRNADAERVLQDGLQNNPRQTGFAMLLARLQVERDALPLALETLQHTLPYAEKLADYQAFVAALLQRQNRHQEAVDYYRKALQLKPQSGVWLMGMGISLRAEQRNTDARDAFKRALETNTLGAELQAFVTQQLKEL